MKKFIVFTLLIFGFLSCNSESEAEIGEYTTIEVDETYDAGTVAKGEIVEAKIEIKNTGDFPLVIASVRAACSVMLTFFYA
jgi:hypothetical protein